MTYLGEGTDTRWLGSALVALLGAAMVTSTLLQGALGVLSRFILDEFGITRSQFGLVFSAYSIVGGVSALYIGRLADRNSRGVMMGLFALAVIAMVGASVSPHYLLFIFAVVLGGLALGAGNPVTNRIVSEHIPLRRRGLVIGTNQAGPPLGLFLAGIVLPSIAVATNWRVALFSAVLLPGAGLLGTFFLVPGESKDRPVPVRVSDLDGMVRFVVRWLTFIGFCVAMANSAAIAFLPLYAQEDLAMTTTLAGMVAATMGLAAVGGRVIWGALGNRFRKPSSALLIIAGFSAASFAALAMSAAFGVPWLWAGAIGSGGSVLAWHAVAWLVIIDRVDLAAIGRASGIMHMGSTFGFAAGAPMAGLLLDASGSYMLMWGLLAAAMVVVTAVTAQFRITAARR
jgi:predicted MFS family arabinose efflux permease